MVDGALLKRVIERIENVESDIRDLSADRKELYASAKESGLLPKAIRKVLADRRGKTDEEKEVDEVADQYRVALGMTPLEAAIEDQQRAEASALIESLRRTGNAVEMTDPAGNGFRIEPGPDGRPVIRELKGELAACRGIEPVTAPDGASGEGEKIDTAETRNQAGPEEIAQAGTVPSDKNKKKTKPSSSSRSPASPHAKGGRRKELQAAVVPVRGRRPPKPDPVPGPPEAA